jgi:hypothetical protein
LSTTRTRVTKREAERVLAAVKRAFPAYLDKGGKYGPKLVKDWDWGWTTSHVYEWAIIWEEGPYEWTYNFPEGGVDEELTAELHTIVPDAKPITTKAVELPDGVWTEPITSWAIAIYPKDWA